LAAFEATVGSSLKQLTACIIEQITAYGSYWLAA